MGRFSLNKTPLDVLKKIAVKIKVLRKEKKLSQSELSKRSGVSVGSLRRFEQTGQISLESLLKIIHVLDRLDEFDGILNPQKNNKIELLFSDKTRR